MTHRRLGRWTVGWQTARSSPAGTVGRRREHSKGTAMADNRSPGQAAQLDELDDMGPIDYLIIEF
ncbi:MAG TPA: hypothetical protein VE547_20155, partial [Mycobacteriales bacterium]|nr:hypothetical protein [Mycobacteriales bacterium]